MTATIDTPPAVLAPQLEAHARRYIAARTRSGDALLEAVAALADARSAAAHGEWGIFLQAVGLDDSRARALIRLHDECRRDAALADRVRSGWLSEAAARELLPAPADVRAAVLDAAPAAKADWNAIAQASYKLSKTISWPTWANLKRMSRHLRNDWGCASEGQSRTDIPGRAHRRSPCELCAARRHHAGGGRDTAAIGAPRGRPHAARRRRHVGRHRLPLRRRHGGAGQLRRDATRPAAARVTQLRRSAAELG